MVPAPLLLTYLTICLIIGVMGRQRKFGFWGYFFFSLLVTPVISLLTLIGGAPREKSPAEKPATD